MLMGFESFFFFSLCSSSAAFTQSAVASEFSAVKMLRVCAIEFVSLTSNMIAEKALLNFSEPATEKNYLY